MEKSKKQQNTGKLIIVLAMIALLIAILCLGGITFSKYVTNNSSSSLTATVAKWGFVVNIQADNLFGKDYTKASGSTNATKVADGTGVAVKASNVVVAPGTEGSLTFSISGTAEVLAKINLSLNSDAQDVVLKYSDSTPEYHPIKWTLKKGSTAIVENKTLSELVTAIASLEALYVEAGTSVSDTFTLTWSWAFDGVDDTADTLLGYLVAGGQTLTDHATELAKVDQSNSKTSLSFVLTVGIEQVQTKG